MQRRRLAPLAALALGSALVLGACGSDDPKDSGSTGQEGASDTRVEITHRGGTFDPAGARMKVGVGDTVTLVIDADTAGSLHVHSTPEQEVSYESGTSEHEIVIDRPGVVEVESHDPDIVVLQLEVS